MQTESPSETPTGDPTDEPTGEPTDTPTDEPTDEPTDADSASPGRSSEGRSGQDDRRTSPDEQSTAAPAGSGGDGAGDGNGGDAQAPSSSGMVDLMSSPATWGGSMLAGGVALLFFVLWRQRKPAVASVGGDRDAAETPAAGFVPGFGYASEPPADARSEPGAPAIGVAQADPGEFGDAVVDPYAHPPAFGSAADVRLAAEESQRGTPPPALQPSPYAPPMPYQPPYHPGDDGRAATYDGGIEESSPELEAGSPWAPPPVAATPPVRSHSTDEPNKLDDADPFDLARMDEEDLDDPNRTWHFDKSERPVDDGPAVGVEASDPEAVEGEARQQARLGTPAEPGWFGGSDGPGTVPESVEPIKSVGPAPDEPPSGPTPDGPPPAPPAGQSAVPEAETPSEPTQNSLSFSPPPGPPSEDPPADSGFSDGPSGPEERLANLLSAANELAQREDEQRDDRK